VKVSAEIISTGREILMGEIVNTNSAWIAKFLTKLGFKVRRITTVGDEVDEVAKAVKEAINRGNLVVIVTGGLGPTPDDTTAEALARALGRPLRLNEEALRMIEEKCKQRGVEVTEFRRKMAYLPAGGRPLPNPIGMAPGIKVEERGTLILALPGVPKEAYAMFTENVLPVLKEISQGLGFVFKKYLIRGVLEADVAPLLREITNGGHGLYIKTRVTRGGLELILARWTLEGREGGLERVEEELIKELKERGAEVEKLQ